MKKILRLSVLILTVYLAFNSCKKKDKGQEGPTAQEILTASPWNLYLIKGYDEFGNYFISYLENDTYHFKPDGTLYVETESGWSYSEVYTLEGEGDNMRIVIDVIAEYKILVLEDEKMVLSNLPSSAAKEQRKKSPYTYRKMYFKR
jgi:hypothetical protein